MRVENSIRNIHVSIITQIIITLLGFISRKVFIDNLGTEYLGVNGLLTNILSMMSLVEGGIGAAIVYDLYKPLAENNEEKVIALIQLYKKIYGILAIIIFILSLIIYPFLGRIMKNDSSISFLGVVYFLFVFKNMISYLNAHKWSLINADQKGYVLAKYNLLFNIITMVSKVIILIVTQSYIFYLLIECFIFIIQNIYNGKIVNDRYPYIKTKKIYKIDESTKNNLIINVKALFLHNIGTWCVFGTDNILISSFISVATVGLYSNYTMIISQLSSLLTPVIGGIGASVGNLIATESNEKSYKIFKITYLINFWIYSFSAIFLFNLLEPFINWWLGNGLLLDKLTFFIILVNFYITGLRSSINIFKSKGGVFNQDRYVPLVEAVINLGSSLILLKYLGIAGIFLGTTISTIAIPLWTQSYLVYKHIFNKSVFLYFKKYVFYAVITVLVGAFTTYICHFVQTGSFISLVIRGIICITIPNVIYVLVFYKTEEFKYLFEIFKAKLTSISIAKRNFSI